MGGVCVGGMEEENKRKNSFMYSRSTRSSLDEAVTVADVQKPQMQNKTETQVTYISAVPIGGRRLSGGGGGRIAWERRMANEGRIVVEDRQFAIGGFCRSVPMIESIENSAIMKRRSGY
jgi:hypothetical protein